LPLASYKRKEGSREVADSVNEAQEKRARGKATRVVRAKCGPTDQKR